jgi:hypothetical protein
MNLEEARKVFWLKSNHRPIGELLNEGYLNQSRLEWAAQWAYNPNLKQAASVILESMTTSKVIEKPNANEVQAPTKSLKIGVTIEKARSTLWPFAPYKGQLMGELVDSKQLSLKDLGYAIETAWDEKVRQAAIALSLVRLEQVVKEPIPDAGFVHVVSGGRSYSEKQETRLTLIQGVVIGLFLAPAAILLYASMNNTYDSQSSSKSFGEIVSTPAGAIALFLVIGFPVFMVWLINFSLDHLTKRLDKKIEEYRFGQEGEDLAIQTIVQALDGNWRLFRNVNVPGPNKGDLDIILVGPPGVWVLEVKNFRGEYRNIGDTWEYKHGKHWKTASTNPSRQANNNALRLKNFLKADSIDVFVNQAVVWANQESPLTVENPSVAVWQYGRLPDELGNIWHGEKLSEAARNKIADKLSMLCERQKKSK